MDLIIVRALPAMQVLRCVRQIAVMPSLASQTPTVKLRGCLAKRILGEGYFSARAFSALRVLNGASTTNLLATIAGTLPPGSVWTW